jgi:tRNA(Arg) A34 adenosine deaminase TadA
MTTQADHERFMRRAVELAYEAMESGKGRPFGAVVVRNGEIVAEGHNEVPYRMDITAHAETVTLGRATQALSDCDIYVNGVPCPMCMTAIYWSKIRKLYYACPSEDGVAAGFDDAVMYADLARPLHERALPAEQVTAVLDEARACYAAWKARQGR